MISSGRSASKMTHVALSLGGSESDKKASLVAKQLKMVFNRENALAKAVRDGLFSIVVEYNTPLAGQTLDVALGLGRKIAEYAAGNKLVSALAVTDRWRGEPTHDPVDTAVRLSDAAGKPIILHLSGKGSDIGRVRDLLARASSAEIRNVLAVTGDRSDLHPVTRSLGRVAIYPSGYFDSVKTLCLATRANAGTYCGAAVNPYKYNPADLYLQYYKMARKLVCGAEFLVTQAGWDMKKLQELQWYMQMREFEVPVLARLALLSQAEIRRIHEGIGAGIVISRPFAALLQREASVNESQSLAAQLQRLSLQAAGCRLLGFNGVQIAGIPDPRTLEMVVSRVGEALDIYTSWSDWLAAWTTFHAALEFAPVNSPFYVFRNLMKPDLQRYNPQLCETSDRDLPPPHVIDRFYNLAGSFLSSPRCPVKIAAPLQRLLYGGSQFTHEEFRSCEYLNPADCPKRLVYGSCGGSQHNGECEFGEAECFFHRVLALAVERREWNILEGEISGV